MSNKVKDINIKNRKDYFFNDIIMDIRNFDPNNIKIDGKSYKNILIYYTGYVTIKEYVKVYSVNPFYLIFRYVNGYFEEINGNKYLTLVPTNESKENIKRYEELWIKFRNLIRSVTKNSDDYDYDEKYIKIKFDSDDELPLNKTIEIPTITVVVRAIFLENNKYYPHDFLDECLYKIKMKSRNELKEPDIKNRVGYYFNDIINDTKLNFSNIFLDKKIYQNFPVYNISYKTSADQKPLRIRFDKIDGFIISLDGKIKHLILFDYGLFNKTCDEVKYHIIKKSGITNSINHNFGKIRIDSYNSLPIKNILTFNNVTILIKSVVKKNKNKYYHNILLEKGSFKDK